jgi:hypothetical protein
MTIGALQRENVRNCAATEESRAPETVAKQQNYFLWRIPAPVDAPNRKPNVSTNDNQLGKTWKHNSSECVVETFESAWEKEERRLLRSDSRFERNIPATQPTHQQRPRHVC